MAYSIDRMPERISIGRETETGVTDVMIDCGAWVMKWPGMALHAIYTPEGGAPYILQTETDGGVLVWHVTDADTATPGTGRMEIVGEMDGRRKVSAMVKVSVAARMGGTVGHPPEAAQPWVDRVVEAAGRITGMQAQAKTLDAGNGATAEWDGEQGLLTIGVPKGEKGEKGDTGPQGPNGVQGPQGEKGADGKDAVVDATLTQSGQAADAKATGDAVGQLKDDMVSKLPKSPSDWASWTAEEQAAARERIGLDKPFELIETITIDTDDVIEVTRDVTPDGTIYNFESIFIRVTSFNTNMSGLFRAKFSHRTDKYKFDYNYSLTFFNTGYNDFYLLCEKRNGIWNIESILSHTNGVTRGCYAQPDLLNMDKNIITAVNLCFASCAFIVGSEIKIYGVRA